MNIALDGERAKAAEATRALHSFRGENEEAMRQLQAKLGDLQSTNQSCQVTKAVLLPGECSLLLGANRDVERGAEKRRVRLTTRGKLELAL
jgi:hypothetical protein